MKILVTGTAGFIGYHVAKSLLDRNDEIIGIDNLNSYYDISLKQHRLRILNNYKNFNFFKIEMDSEIELSKLFLKFKFDKVIHLAAQAGVRYSIDNPQIYAKYNLNAYLNLLENCRIHQVKHLVYASSSSVYGLHGESSFKEIDDTSHPVSFYAATKKSNEIMAHSYSHLFNLPTTGVRYFTVYGPMGRPDMSPMIFANSIYKKKPINIYNFGKHKRDFTFIDDAVNGTIKILDKIPCANLSWESKQPDPSSSSAPWKIYNIGNGNPVELLYYIELIEKNLGIKAIKNFVPKAQGDVDQTFADMTKLKNEIGFKPKVTIENGIKKFIKWFKEYNSIL